MSSGSAGLAVFSAFTSLFSIAGFAVGAVGVTVTFGLGVVDFAVTAFFTVFFFFKQKTAYEMRISDWSSDVCSSDLRN